MEKDGKLYQIICAWNWCWGVSRGKGTDATTVSDIWKTFNRLWIVIMKYWRKAASDIWETFDRLCIRIMKYWSKAASDIWETFGRLCIGIMKYFGGRLSCSRLPSAFCWLIHCSSPDSGICYSHKLPQVDIEGCCFLMEGHAGASSDLWNLWKSAAAPSADFNHNSAAPPDFHRRSADWSTGRWHSLFSQLVAIMAQTLPTQT